MLSIDTLPMVGEIGSMVKRFSKHTSLNKLFVSWKRLGGLKKVGRVWPQILTGQEIR